MPRDPRAADVLRDKARRAATATETGVALFGKLVVAYYPRCQRYAWFMDGQPVNKRDAIQWLTSPSNTKILETS